jgi:hypothetical protein
MRLTCFPRAAPRLHLSRRYHALAICWDFDQGGEDRCIPRGHSAAHELMGELKGLLSFGVQF